MIYDCVMFNDELDILELRLAYMYDQVDRFVIAESSLTHSNQGKPLFFKDNADRFSKYQDKIYYLEVPPVPQKDSWQGEFYQRNYLKTALMDCKDDDIILIADIDELVDLEYVRKNWPLNTPTLIEMPMYYYFINLKTKVEWLRTLISPYRFIKGFDIGDRLKYHDLKPTILKDSSRHPGWHFSYLFGWDTDLYISKIKSFSHQELNTPYLLNPKRLSTCLSLGVDIWERNSVYETSEPAKEVSPKLYSIIKELGLDKKLAYHKPSLLFYLNFYNLKYYIKFSVKPRLKMWLDKHIAQK
jgi:beta-1,4-mannosyl-glycoprotein beta-1,4-N-acetylglucosaminyltransferase